MTGVQTCALPISLQKIDRGVKIKCVGASYPLKEQSAKIWKNKTASEIATEVAKKFKLKAFVTPHPTRFNQVSMSGHSYWEKLNELATKIGYSVQVYGTELHFHPIDKMIDQFMTTIPVMAFIDPFSNAVSTYNAQTLESFKPRHGDFVEKEGHLKTTKNVSNVDPLTSTVFTYKSSPSLVGKNLKTDVTDPLFSSVETRVVTASSKMAKDMADAKAQLSRLSIPAKAIGQGDPRIAPWRTVEVRGVNETSDGFWIVKSATHFVHIDGRDRKSTRLNSSHIPLSRMPSSA